MPFLTFPNKTYFKKKKKKIINKQNSYQELKLMFSSAFFTLYLLAMRWIDEPRVTKPCRTSTIQQPKSELTPTESFVSKKIRLEVVARKWKLTRKGLTQSPNFFSHQDHQLAWLDFNSCLLQNSQDTDYTTMLLVNGFSYLKRVAPAHI